MSKFLFNMQIFAKKHVKWINWETNSWFKSLTNFCTMWRSKSQVETTEADTCPCCPAHSGPSASRWQNIQHTHDLSLGFHDINGTDYLQTNRAHWKPRDCVLCVKQRAEVRPKWAYHKSKACFETEIHSRSVPLQAQKMLRFSHIRPNSNNKNDNSTKILNWQGINEMSCSAGSIHVWRSHQMKAVQYIHM